MSDRSENHRQVADGLATETLSPSSPLSLSDRVRSLRLPDRPTRQASGSSWLPWLLCFLLGGAAGYLGYERYLAESPVTEPETNATATSATDVRPSQPAPGSVALTAGGYVIPIKRVKVSPKVGGEVIELYIEEGQRVKKGDKLAQLDPAKYAFEYRRLKATAEQAKADWEKAKNGGREEEKKQFEENVREAEERCSQLRGELRRLQQAGSGATELDRDNKRSEMQQAEFKVNQIRQMKSMMRTGRPEEIEKARATYDQVLAQMDNAKYDLDCALVVAPVDGIILLKNAEVGNTVKPEAFSNGLSASLCEMANLKELEVDIDVSERDLNGVFVGQKCDVRAEAFPDKGYKGYVSRLMPEANRSKASVSVRVRIEVPDDDTLLRPEMRARVKFFAPEEKKTPEKGRSSEK